MTAAAAPQPWERRPEESDQAWAAFVVFRDMPDAQRSINEVGRLLVKSGSLIDRWAARHHWQERVRAHQADQDHQWLADLAHQRHLAAQRHVRLAQTAQDVAGQALQTLVPGDLRPADIIRMTDLGVKIERDALGMTNPPPPDQTSAPPVHLVGAEAIADAQAAIEARFPSRKDPPVPSPAPPGDRTST